MQYVRITPQHSIFLIVVAQMRRLQIEAAYLNQRIHQSLSISQSLVCTNCAIITHFDIYKWHEDDLSRVADAATAGKILAQLPVTSLAAPAPSSPGRCFIQWLRVETDSVPEPRDALQNSTPMTKLQLQLLHMLWWIT